MRYEKTAKLIKTFRELRDVSQGDLAKHLGFTCPQAISNFECGRAPLPLKHIEEIRLFLKFPRVVLERALLQDYRRHIHAHAS